MALIALAVAVQTKGFGVPVSGGDVTGDRRFEVFDRTEDTTFQALPGEPGEEALDGIQPGARGRREVERPARMLGEPSQHLGVFVGGVVVEDGVDQLAGLARTARRSR